ncbi:hypothetical protein DXG03_003230 [Asterophora parasitica]|uniref:Uncharacterized protein n=1 Tax=Asterophora parasitica TaxID=117018 RepID=A0A9P7GFD8_9AGAR|nr:hypothetical protein DXG03_003230 [Asterophora parasitica]
MDKTKMRLAAFFDNDEEESSFPQKTVDDAKLSQYTAGKVRKSKREKDQEAAEAKKREEEANAAKAYAEFIDAFEGEGVGRKKGGTSFVKAESNTSYAPDKAFPDRQQRPGPPTNRVCNIILFPFIIRTELADQSPSPSAAPKPKGKRAMDAFLEEIKK